MTILELNNYFYRRGGSETALFETIAALEERGHTVVPFAMADEKNEPSEYASFFPTPAKRWELWKRLYNRNVARSLERLIVEVRPDVAHLHNIAYHLTPAVIAVLRRHRIPMVQTLHDYQAVSPLPLLFSRGRIHETRERWSWLGVIAHHAVHRSLMASIAAVLHSSLDRIFGWTRSVNRYLAPSLFMANIAARYGLPEEHITVVKQSLTVHDDQKPEVRSQRSEVARGYFLYIGRLSEEKGIAQLIRWWAKLPPFYRLLIVGSGPEEARLRELARRLCVTNILWYGACTNPERLHEILKGAQALLVPSQWYENAPYVILEAMSRRVPVIASDIGGIPEFVDPSRGWLVRHDDPDGWRAAIRWVAEHPAEGRERAARSRLWLMEHRSRSAYGAQLERAFAEAVSCARAGEWCAVEIA
jgi:glycosyltransferase involved in cell wall biosynthesis